MESLVFFLLCVTEINKPSELYAGWPEARLFENFAAFRDFVERILLLARDLSAVCNGY
jgi:hypothetical protein